MLGDYSWKSSFFPSERMPAWIIRQEFPFGIPPNCPESGIAERPGVLTSSQKYKRVWTDCHELFPTLKQFFNLNFADEAIVSVSFSKNTVTPKSIWISKYHEAGAGWGMPE